MEKEKLSCNTTPKRNAIEFDSLRFKKCIFMTDEQYNKNKIHKPTQTLFIEKLIYVNEKSDIDYTIISIIDEIHNKLSKIYYLDIKIPYPIFVMLGRELEHHSNLFEDETFPVPSYLLLPSPKSMKYGNIEIPLQTGELAIIKYIKGFFNSGLSNDTDKLKYDTSILKSYQFKGRVRIFLYVPFLTNEYKFVSNLIDLSNSFYFFNTLIESDFYMNITKTSTFDADKFRQEFTKRKLDSRIIELIIDTIQSNDKTKYSLYDDLVNLCFDGGCVSDVGDDFNSLIPSFTDDDDTNNKNATEKSPFMPTKCLSKTNGYLCNVRFAPNNMDIYPFIRKNALKEIKENLSSYTTIAYKVEKGLELTKEDGDYVSKYKSPVNLIVSIINDYIKKYYSNNLNDDKKDDIKVNHYSKKYSENIIKELAYLKKMNGIPEYVMSLYYFNEKLRSSKINYMPFRDTFPTYENLFNLNGEEFKVNQMLFSFNKKYGMILLPNGFVPIINFNTRKIIYFMNKTVIRRPIEMTIQENGLYISNINSDENKMNRNYLTNISSLVDNCDKCSPPFSLILKDDGMICIYGNGFYDSTSKEFKEYINNEIEFIKKYNENNKNNGGIDGKDNEANLDNISLIQDYLNKKTIIEERGYLFCSPDSINCK
jgi:hypothetical protein